MTTETVPSLSRQIEDLIRAYVREAGKEAPQTRELFVGFEEAGVRTDRRPSDEENRYLRTRAAPHLHVSATRDPHRTDEETDAALDLAVRLMVADLRDLAASVGGTMDDVAARCAMIA